MSALSQCLRTERNVTHQDIYFTFVDYNARLRMDDLISVTREIASNIN